MAEKRKFSFGRACFTFLITVVTCFCLVAAGFAVCLIPQTTSTVAGTFSGNAQSPFTKDQLVTAAIAGREYTVDTNDREALIKVIAEINDEAKTPYAKAPEEKLLAAPDTYVLTPDALSHLDDCYRVFSIAKIVCLIAAAVMVIGLIIVRARSGRKTFGRALFASGLIVLLAFIALAVWIILDFSSFFAAFHSLFFADGTWTFSANSLLISMYPIQFWIAMAVIWLVVSCVLCVIFMAIGRALIRRAKRKEQAVKEAAIADEPLPSPYALQPETSIETRQDDHVE